MKGGGYAAEGYTRMTEAIIVAVITAAATICAQLIISNGNRQKQETITAAHNAEILLRVTELEKKVDKHNNLIERMVLVEASTRDAHRRIDDICKLREGDEH